MEESEGLQPVVKVFRWESMSAESPIGGQLSNEDDRELAFLDVVIRQFSTWEPERVRRVLAYLADRFTERPS